MTVALYYIVIWLTVVAFGYVLVTHSWGINRMTLCPNFLETIPIFLGQLQFIPVVPASCLVNSPLHSQMYPDVDSKLNGHHWNEQVEDWGSIIVTVESLVVWHKECYNSCGEWRN